MRLNFSSSQAQQPINSACLLPIVPVSVRPYLYLYLSLSLSTEEQIELIVVICALCSLELQNFSLANNYN